MVVASSSMAAVLIFFLAFFASFHGTTVRAGSGKHRSSSDNKDHELLTKSYLSPPLDLYPGQAAQKFFFAVPFPNDDGEDIGIKTVEADMVYEDGITPAPLTEAYLHHWVFVNYRNQSSHDYATLDIAGNNGLCPHGSLSYIYGVGAESRRTNSTLPGPFALRLPFGQKMILNLHAIDTRSAVDVKGCFECNCKTYNATPPNPNYAGGIACCVDGSRCLPIVPGPRRRYYLRYTVHYYRWQPNREFLRPVALYLVDATYDPKSPIGCALEYDVPPCASGNNGTCIHTLETKMPPVPLGGNVVFGVAHQHVGAIHASIIGEDGRDICTSVPMYGTGREVGNEAGYVVGMSSCRPEFGSLNVTTGERISSRALYNNTQPHPGVMSLGYIAVYTGYDQYDHHH